MSIPTILDTDIGHDVDDVWALTFLLQCPELDVKLITTSTGDTVYRARIVAKILQRMGREHIPIGIGIPLDDNPHTHERWLEPFELRDYQGVVLRDGIGALCDVITQSPEPVKLICIGPLPNIAGALARAPEICNNATFIGMHGSLRRGYLNAPKPMREFNVKQHALACRAVFEASWDKVITPLDTCGNVILDGERFAAVRHTAEHESEDHPARIAFDNHLGWFEAVSNWPILKDIDPLQQSSILYDLVAIYLGFDESCLHMETLPIVVTPDGKTLIDDAGKPVRCATEWKDKEGFLDLVTARLIGQS